LFALIDKSKPGDIKLPASTRIISLSLRSSLIASALRLTPPPTEVGQLPQG